MIGLIGLIVGLGLLIYLAVRGWHLLLAAPLTALIVAITNGLPIFITSSTVDHVAFISAYMEGFVRFFKDWFFIFLCGAIFGKAMEYSRSADSIAHWAIAKIGINHASLAVVGACAILTYGGVSVFTVAFCVYSMALSIFKDANLPRRFLPAVIAFGSVTFTMTSAGSPEIQNWIPVKYLGTTPYAGWQVSLVVALCMACAGYAWLHYMLKKAIAAGECFEERAGDTFTLSKAGLPHPVKSLLAIVTVILLSFMLHKPFGTSALIIALCGGILVIYILNVRHFTNKGEPFSEGATGALIAIANTCAVVGFGTVAKETLAFVEVVNFITTSSGGGLLGAAIAVSLICGLTGSSSGGQAIALPLLAPIYIGAEVPETHQVEPDQLHRVVSIASGALDSLPHNGYVVTLIRSICQETHKGAYMPLAALTVIIPLIGTGLAIILFSI